MMTPVPLPAPLENRQSHQGFPATVSSRGASTTRRRGSTSGRVAARRATSGSAPSSKRPASENEDLNPAPAASCTLQEKDIRVLQVVDNQDEEDALPIRFLDVGHHQSGLGVDGQTDVVVPLQQYLLTAFFQDGIQAGETPQSHGTRLHNEGQVRELNPPF